MSSFSGFREGINFLKRRFSSNDLPSESQDEAEPVATTTTATTTSTETNKTEATTTANDIPTTTTTSTTSTTSSSANNDIAVNSQFIPNDVHSTTAVAIDTATTTTASATSATTTTAAAATTTPAPKSSSLLSFPQRGTYPSAPSSPSKNTGSSGGSGGGSGSSSSKSSDGLSFTRSLFGRNTSSQQQQPQQQRTFGIFDKHVPTTTSASSNAAATSTTATTATTSAPQVGLLSKVLLVVDDSLDVVWSTYFQANKQLSTAGINLSVEQTDFSNMVMTSSTLDNHVTVHLKNATSKSFSPDIVLIRQKVKDINDDWRPMIGGFILGGVTCVNTPTSLYNSADRQWMMAKLEALKRLNGSDMPLIERKFFSRSVDCTKVTLEFPLVMKSELHHNGNGIIKIETERDWLELLNFSNQSNFTIEPFIEALYDIRVQKIGDHYRAFKRTSLSGSWKISCGQVVLEEIPLPDRYKKWLVECSRVFDEMDICALQLLTNSDGKEFVIDAYDSTMPLLGDTQEEDRKLIADVIVDRLKQQCLNAKRATNGSSGKILKNVKSTSRDQVEDSEDTMRNLRKTFAGIFGDM